MYQEQENNIQEIREEAKENKENDILEAKADFKEEQKEENQTPIDSILLSQPKIKDTTGHPNFIILAAQPEYFNEFNTKLDENRMLIEATDANGNNVIFATILYENLLALRSLIDIDKKLLLKKNEDGLTPLQYASHQNNNEIIELIAEQGLEISGINQVITKISGEERKKINQRNSFQSTALHIMVAKNNKDGVSILVENGANLEIENRHGQTPLIFSCSKIEYHDMAQYLLSFPVLDIDKRDKKGYNAIFFATFNNNENLLTSLVETGASIMGKFTNKSGKEHTLLEIAEQDKVKEFLERQMMSKEEPRSSIISQRATALLTSQVACQVAL